LGFQSNTFFFSLLAVEPFPPLRTSSAFPRSFQRPLQIPLSLCVSPCDRELTGVQGCFFFHIASSCLSFQSFSLRVSPPDSAPRAVPFFLFISPPIIGVLVYHDPHQKTLLDFLPHISSPLFVRAPAPKPLPIFQPASRPTWNFRGLASPLY